VPLADAIARVEEFLPASGKIEGLAFERLGQTVAKGD
jgi:hypothetical protein